MKIVMLTAKRVRLGIKNFIKKVGDNESCIFNIAELEKFPNIARAAEVESKFTG